MKMMMIPVLLPCILLYLREIHPKISYHTWKEINSYSVYDYEDMGVERYQVAGLLQVGDENGPTQGEVGYGESVPNATVQIRGQTSSQNAQKKL